MRVQDNPIDAIPAGPDRSCLVNQAIMAFVDDEGPGLPKDASSDRLFALFAKGKDRPRKAGLALYFCKITVERWSGSIGAENCPGGGSHF